MGDIFDRDQEPSEVVAAIIRHGSTRWEDLSDADRALGVPKLRLAGVYDDRQSNHFMVRVRVPGGVLRADQVAAVAGVADDLSQRPADVSGPERFAEITTRQGFQLHWIRFESLPELWRRLHAVGLSTERACGDTLRNVTTCPVDGVDARAVVDGGPVVAALGDLVVREPRLTAFLPRKFKVVVSGCPADCAYALLNDLAFVPARRAGEAGFNVYAGGGLSDSPRLASPLDLFVRPAEVPVVVRAALELFDARGDRLHKAVNRFRILVHQLGVPMVRDEIARRLPFAATAAGDDLSTWEPDDHLGVHPDRQGTNYAGLCVPVGRLSAVELNEVARLARACGDGGVRLTQRQNLILTGVADPERLLSEPLLARLRPFADPFERAVVACTSAPFCKFAIINAKAYGLELIDYLRRRLPEATWPGLQGLRLHVSGCKASCALVQAAHIGLRGAMARTDTEHLEAFDLASAGGPGLARWAALEVPSAHAFNAVAEALVAAAAAGTGPHGAARLLAAAVREGDRP
jgi:ferredoxin-nitrite reductase